MGFPVVLKIVSPEILHKTEAGGVLVGVKSARRGRAGLRHDHGQREEVRREGERCSACRCSRCSAAARKSSSAPSPIPSFGKLVAFGLGGVLVEVLKDITFRLAPATKDDALSMLDGIAAAEILKGVRGADPVNRDALAGDDRQRVAARSPTSRRSPRWT